MSVHVRTPCAAVPASQRLPTCDAKGGWVLVATVLGSSMAFIDGTVVNVALPAIQASFGSSMAALQWVVEGYALMLATLIVVGGGLGDRYGQRRIFVLGAAAFALTSAWCGLAGSAGGLIVARVAQGAAGALLVPASLALLSAAYPQAQRGRAIGLWSGFTAASTAAGPPLGGWLVDAFSWRYVFFINAPVALVVVGIAWLAVREERPAAPEAPLDWPGTVLLAGGLGAIVFGLIEAGRLSLGHPLVVGSVAAGVAAMGAFLVVERRVRAPLVPLHLFRSRDFTGTNVLTLLLYGALSGALFLWPFNLIQLQGYSAEAVGLAFLPFVGTMSVLARFAGQWQDRVGPRPLLVGGTVITAAGFALMAVPGVGGSYWTTFFPGITVLGVGMALAVTPLTTTVLNAVDDAYAGIASGVNNAVSRVGGLLAIAAVGLLALAVFDAALDAQLTHRQVPEAAVQALAGERGKLAAAELSGNFAPGVRQAVARAVDLAFLRAFRVVMLGSAMLALAGAAVAAVLIGPKPRPAG